MNLLRSFSDRIAGLLDRIQPSGTAMLFGMAIVVGAGTGLGAILFIQLIAWVGTLFYQGGQRAFGFLGNWLFVLAPLAGGLIAGPIIAFFAKEAKGHGVPEVMKAIALRGGRIRPRVVLAKIFASALCIGSGGSAGREGPIVQVGAALGSTIGQWLNLSELRMRNLVACGAAAGIAATFNAPIAGVLFAMEIILGEFHLSDMGNVIISAVTAATISRVFIGERPAFSIPNYGMQTPWEVLLYALLGLLAALAAIFFIRMLYGFEEWFDHWHFPDALKPAVGGLLLGLLALLSPAALSWMGISSAPYTSNSLPPFFSSGFSTIEQALTGTVPIGLLLALVLLKPLATSFTLGSGNSGGVFAPSLFVGAVLGGAFGFAVDALAPGATAGPGAFAVVGMAAVFAGAARAPFTAILIVFEMTNDYRMIVPLMAGVIVSLIAAERLHPESIYTLKLTRQGIHLERGRDVDVMEAVRVEEVMVRDPLTVSEGLAVPLLAEEFLRTGRHGFPVVSEDGSLAGVVSLEDYRRATAEAGEIPAERLTVGEIASKTPVTAFPDESVGAVLRRMAPRDLSRLPVVDREDPARLLGVVRRNDIVRAYEVGVTRREEARQFADAKRKMGDARAAFLEIRLTAESYATGKRVADLRLSRNAVLVSIRRGADLVIPRGDTVLAHGDIITALCESGSMEDIRQGLIESQE